MRDWRRRSVHHWGRYAVVCVLTLASLPLLERDSGWAMAAFVVWNVLMHGLYWDWVRKD